MSHTRTAKDLCPEILITGKLTRKADSEKRGKSILTRVYRILTEVIEP